MNRLPGHERTTCQSCGADPGIEGTPEKIICQYCGVSIDRPIPVGVVAELAEPIDPEWMSRWRAELGQLETQQSGRLVRLLLCIFALLVPGLAVAIGGPVAFGLHGSVLGALVTGLFGFAWFVCGVIMTVGASIAIKRGKNELQAKRVRLHAHTANS